MKVTCKANSGENLTEKALSIGNIPKTKFNLVISHSYNVYGICVWNEVLHYLLIGHDNSAPSWYPAELFDVSEHLLPIEWYFNYYGHKQGYELSAIWGYKELALDESHYDGLLERDGEALEVFLKRKREMDNYMF